MPSIITPTRNQPTHLSSKQAFWLKFLPLPLSLGSLAVLALATLLLASLALVLVLANSSDSAALRAALLLAVLPTAVASAPLVVWDHKFRLLPNRIVLPLFVPGFAGLAIASFVANEPERFWRALTIAVLVGVVLLLLMLLPGQHLGGGDLKLLVLLLLLTAWWSPLLAAGGFILATLIAAVWAVVLRLVKGARSIPFGPPLIAGYFLAACVASF